MRFTSACITFSFLITLSTGVAGIPMMMGIRNGATIAKRDPQLLTHLLGSLMPSQPQVQPAASSSDDDDDPDSSGVEARWLVEDAPTPSMTGFTQTGTGTGTGDVELGSAVPFDQRTKVAASFGAGLAIPPAFDDSGSGGTEKRRQLLGGLLGLLGGGGGGGGAGD